MEIRHRRYKIAVNALRALIVFVGFALIPSVFGGYEFGYYETGSFFIRLYYFLENIKNNDNGNMSIKIFQKKERILWGKG